MKGEQLSVSDAHLVVHTQCRVRGRGGRAGPSARRSAGADSRCGRARAANRRRDTAAPTAAAQRRRRVPATCTTAQVHGWAQLTSELLNRVSNFVTLRKHEGTKI